MGTPIRTDKKLNEVLSDKEMLDRMVKLIKPKSSYSVLDLGTGKGNAAITLAPHVNKVIAIDSDESVINDCRENVKVSKYAKKIKIQKADVNKLHFSSKSFHLVTCRAAFHHFPNKSKVLKEIHRVLKDDGVFYLMDPIFSDYAKEIWTPIAKIRETDLDGFLTYLETIELLTDSGFKVVKIVPFYFRRVFDEWIKNAPKNIETRLKKIVLSLDKRILNELHFRRVSGKWIYNYNVIELIAIKK